MTTHSEEASSPIITHALATAIGLAIGGIGVLIISAVINAPSAKEAAQQAEIAANKKRAEELQTGVNDAMRKWEALRDRLQLRGLGVTRRAVLATVEKVTFVPPKQEGPIAGGHGQQYDVGGVKLMVFGVESDVCEVMVVAPLKADTFLRGATTMRACLALCVDKHFQPAADFCAEVLDARPAHGAYGVFETREVRMELLKDGVFFSVRPHLEGGTLAMLAAPIAP